MANLERPPEPTDPRFKDWIYQLWKRVIANGVATAATPSSGVLSVPSGGTGATSLSGYLKGNGTNPVTAVGQIPYADLSGVPNTRVYGPNIDALDNTSTTGIYAITGIGASAVRTMTGTASRLSITNGNGVSGNPTLDISMAYVGQASITTLGTITTGVWDAQNVTSSGSVTLATVLALVNTSSSTTGVITKSGNRFIHNFNYGFNGTVTTQGGNTFIGDLAGNFTMGATATSAGESSYNTGSGQNTLAFVTTGYQNSAYGVATLLDVTSGFGNSAYGFNTGRGITTGSGNTVLGASVTGLAAALTNNIILANGTGAIKAQHDGTTWALTGAVSGAFNGSVGATTPNTGAFTTVTGAFNGTLGATTRNTVAATTISGNNSLTLDTSTANTVHYITNTSSNGVQLQMFGNGATTPNKFLRVGGGLFDIVNSAYTSQIFTLNDAGDLSLTGGVTATKATLSNGANNSVINNIPLKRDTTDATVTELTTDGAAGSGATNRIVVPNNTTLSVVVNICAKVSGSSSSKQMLRQFLICNNAGTTAIEGAVTTLGTDITSAALVTATTTITANNTDDCIRIDVTGVAATNIRWTAYVVSSNVLYA